MVYRLSAMNERTDDLVEREQFGLRDVRAFTRVDKDVAVVLVRRVVVIVLLSQDTCRFAFATIADIGRQTEFQAELLRKAGQTCCNDDRSNSV